MFKFKDLFDVLVHERVLSDDNLSQLSRFVERWSVSQYTSVIETNLLSESRLLDILAKSLSLKRMRSLKGSTTCLQCIKTFSKSEVEKNGFIILAESTLVKTFVCADPFVIPDYFKRFQGNDSGDSSIGTGQLALSTKSEIDRKIHASYGAYNLANMFESQFAGDSKD